ncbi:MAG: hypothetical protein FWG66_04780 [Spirochaetes bacterium]|nr:hypothetical protein [Spirochaetota bacterium]
MKDKLRRCIYESCERDGFSYGDLALKKIFDAFDEEKAGFRQEIWIKVFIQALARIKRGNGVADVVDKESWRVFLPIDRERAMSVFFKKQPESRYFVDDFKIVDI